MMPAAQAMDISVCIANYNGGHLVLDCVESVYAQQGTFKLEVLVHDDASSDDSLTRIRERFPHVRIIASDTNHGFCISNNRMVEASTGRYVLLLNNDALLRPDTLESLFRTAEGGHGDWILGLPQHAMADGMLVDRGYRTDPFLNPIPMNEPGTHEAGVATRACLWIPRRIWDAVGGFPPWFESVAEDIFLCFAARLLGHRVMVLEGPGFDHWVGRNLGGGKLVDGALQTTVRRRRLSERNKTYVMLCCYPCLLICLLLPLHAVLLICEALFLMLSGTGVARVRDIYARLPSTVWDRRRDILLLRRCLMRQRRAGTRNLFAFTQWIPRKLTMLIRHGRPTVD